MRQIIIMALAAALLVACGGAKTTDSERVLHLGNLGTMTEEAYRMQTRTALTEASGIAACRGIQGLSDAEVVAIADHSGDADDDLRAAAIFKEECTRVLKGE